MRCALEEPMHRPTDTPKVGTPLREARALVRTDLARELLSFLSSKSMPLVVVGDPAKVGQSAANDIDIVVSPLWFDRLSGLLADFAEARGGCLAQMLHHEESARYFVLAFWQGSRLGYLKVDACTDYLRRGRLLIRAEDLLDGAELSEFGFRTPRPEMAFAYYLLKRIEKGNLEAEQFAYLRRLWSREPSKCFQVARSFLGTADAELIQAAIDSNSFVVIAHNLKRLRRSVRRLDVSLFWAWYRELKRGLRRVAAPTGLHVCLLGPDGIGKSSVISETREVLKPLFRRVRRYHFRPHFDHEPKGVGGVPRPHEMKARSPIASLSKLGYWLLDYWSSYVLRLYWWKAASTLLLFDRYGEDLLVDSARYRYGGPDWAARAFTALLPRADVYVFLMAPVEQVLERKQELTLDEVQRQLDAYRSLAATLPNARIVDAAWPLDQVCYEVERIIVGEMNRRTLHRIAARRS